MKKLLSILAFGTLFMTTGCGKKQKNKPAKTVEYNVVKNIDQEDQGMQIIKKDTKEDYIVA